MEQNPLSLSSNCFYNNILFYSRKSYVIFVCRYSKKYRIDH